METWFLMISTLCICAVLKFILNILVPNKKHAKLPPARHRLPVIGNLWLLRKSFSNLEDILRDLKKKKGPIFTFWFLSRPSIFISSHSLAHKALIQNGALLSNRPKPPPISKVFSSNQHNISSATYGPTWRILRRNLTSEILHPSRIKSYSNARKWVLQILIGRLKSESHQNVKVMDQFQYAMFCLLALMCFGDKLDEERIKKIEATQRKLLLKFGGVSVLNLFPLLGKVIFRKQWKELYQFVQDQNDVLVPLIQARIEAKRRTDEGRDLENETVAYVDTLVDLQLSDEKRKLNMGELVSICSEFLNAGTDTTATALQWIMANVVKFPEIQEKVYQEIFQVVAETEMDDGGFVKEEDLQKLPYLKAVVLEALRRHPPGHFLLPHSVSEEVELEGYVIPKDATLNVMVADLGWDPNVWEEPMEFKPERFLDSSNNLDHGFDITGSREIKMLPFGAGRRICPGLGLALLHLEYFVANLIWYFEWQPVDGDTNSIDLSDKQEFTWVMKNPLQARIFPRVQSA